MQWLWAICHCPSLSPCMGIDEVFSLLPPSTPLIQDENSQMQCPSCQVIDSDICLAHYQALFNILQFDFLWFFFFIFCHFELSINVFIYAPWCLSSMEGNKEWWRLKGFQCVLRKAGLRYGVSECHIFWWISDYSPFMSHSPGTDAAQVQSIFYTKCDGNEVCLPWNALWCKRLCTAGKADKVACVNLSECHS